MKTPGDILLVACYELGHQPLAVAWPAAFLEREGYTPAVMDVAVEPFDETKAARAQLAAISVPMHTALRLGVMVADRIRTINSTCHVCFYGLYASLNAEYLLSHGADSVIGGECETPLVELVRSLERREGRPVPGVGRRGEASSPHLAKLPFTVPSRRNLPSLEQYVHLERNGKLELTGYVEASRGCLHHCRHCPIPPVYGGRFFIVPKEICLADIRQQIEAGATHLTFGDPDFLNGPGHALAVARALHAEFPSVTFDFTAKIEHLLRRRELLPEFARLGCLFIVSAVESLSDTVLVHLDKGHTRADVVEALSAARAAGIALRPTWVPFTPWTTVHDYRDMLDFIEAEDLIDHVDPVQYSIRLLVPPGALLLNSEAMAPHLGGLVPHAFYYRWTHPDPRMERLHETVTALVSEAAEQYEDARLTFHRIRRLADEAGGAENSRTVVPAVTDRPRPPRLTEPWFC